MNKLDQELLLAFVLNKSRAYVMAHQPIKLNSEQQIRYDALIARRNAGEPLAYLLGEKEFWSLNFIVTPDVLIPRADTECLVEFVLEQFKAEKTLKLADIGTGSGAIAIALAHEKPTWNIDAVDISLAALEIAKLNAQKNNLKNINFIHSDLCENLPARDYAVIISNPPYIAVNDAHLADLQFEPQTALVSGVDGLDAIRSLVAQAKNYLKSAGLLIIEHGYDQAVAVQEIFTQESFCEVKTWLDLAGNSRFTTGLLR